MTINGSDKCVSKTILSSLPRADYFGARFLGARFTVPIQAQRIEIFNPVLDSIERHIPKLLSDYYPTSPKVLIMLSGPLAECPYAHTYLASCIEAQIRLIVSPGSPIAGISLLHTKDE